MKQLEKYTLVLFHTSVSLIFSKRVVKYLAFDNKTLACFRLLSLKAFDISL